MQVKIGAPKPAGVFYTILDMVYLGWTLIIVVKLVTKPDKVKL